MQATLVVEGTPVQTLPSFYLKYLDNGSPNCGATLLSALWAVTAAHCVTGGSVSVETACGETIASATFCHPAYDPSTLMYDICMLRLSRESTCSPIGVDVAGEVGTVIGFGGQEDAAVQEMSADVLTDCVWAVDQTTQLCAQGTAPTDTCFGDSGGPLYGESLWGIVSYGDVDCDGSYPTAFTRASAFTGWMLAYTSANQDDACACTCGGSQCTASALCDDASYPDWQVYCYPAPLYAIVLAVAGTLIFCVAVAYVLYPRVPRMARWYGAR